jgi:hypothetical protein
MKGVSREVSDLRRAVKELVAAALPFCGNARVHKALLLPVVMEVAGPEPWMRNVRQSVPIWELTLMDGARKTLVHCLARGIEEAVAKGLEAYISEVPGRSEYITVANVMQAKETGVRAWP